MYIPGFVMRELLTAPGFGQKEWAVYLAALTLRPKSISELSVRAAIARNIAAAACDLLAQRGWLFFAQNGRSRQPIAAIPDRCQERMAQALEAAYEMAVNRGEFLMKRVLDYLVDTDEYVQRPSWVFDQPVDQGAVGV